MNYIELLAKLYRMLYHYIGSVIENIFSVTPINIIIRGVSEDIFSETPFSIFWCPSIIIFSVTLGLLIYPETKKKINLNKKIKMKGILNPSSSKSSS